jgi:hypothetical protein
MGDVFLAAVGCPFLGRDRFLGRLGRVGVQ